MTSFRSVYFDDPPHKGRILDIFPAAEPKHEVALFFIHGGGWRQGSRTVFHDIIHQFRALGFDCASTDYGLGGTPFDQIADIHTGLEIFAADLSQRNRPTNIVLIGSSAGAHLALLLALSCSREAVNYTVSGLAVQAALFTFEPWEDIFPGSWDAMRDSMRVPYEGNEAQYQQASPIHHVTSGQPPIFVMHADNEHMFPREQCEAFAEKYLGCGNRIQEKTYRHTEHGFFYSLERRQQREAFEDIRQFVVSLEG